jgi:hypothetical protein
MNFSISREALRLLVDLVWQHATDSKSVPSTRVADKLIDEMLVLQRVLGRNHGPLRDSDASQNTDGSK